MLPNVRSTAQATAFRLPDACAHRFSTPEATYRCARRQFYGRALDAYEAADALCSRQATLRSQILKTTGLMRKFGPRPGEGPKGADDDDDDGEEEGDEEGGEG